MTVQDHPGASPVARAALDIVRAGALLLHQKGEVCALLASMSTGERSEALKQCKELAICLASIIDTAQMSPAASGAPYAQTSGKDDGTLKVAPHSATNITSLEKVAPRKRTRGDAEQEPTGRAGRLRALVLSNPDLLEHMLGFLGRGQRARENLGQFATVSKFWRDVAWRETLWSHAVGEVLPVMGLMEGQELVKAAGGFRPYIREFGRCLMQPHVLIGQAWRASLYVHFEIFDARDGMHILSVMGPPEVTDFQDLVYLRVRGPRRREVVGPSFSAESRDPLHHRFNSIGDFFRRAHEVDKPPRLAFQATVINSHTGKMAVIARSGKENRLHCNHSSPLYDDDLVGRDVQSVVTFAWTRISHPWLGGWQSLDAGFEFVLEPEQGQAGVPDAQMQWKAVGGPAEMNNEYSFVNMHFNTEDAEDVKRFLWSVVH